MRAKIHTRACVCVCVAHIYMYTPGESPLYEIPGGGVEGLVHVLVEERSGEKNGEYKVAQDRGSIADIRLS